MKTFKLISLLTISIGLISPNLFAQGSPKSEPKTLFRNSTAKNIRFMLSPAYSLTTIGGSSASLASLRGGATFNDKFTLGVFYNLSLNDIRQKNETNPNVYMDYRTGGGFIEYTAFANKVLHLTFPLFIGGGEIEMDNESGNITNLGEQNFFLVEPEALAEVNLHKYVRLNLGIGYRVIANKINYQNLSQADISGWTGYVGLKFGLF